MEKVSSARVRARSRAFPRFGALTAISHWQRSEQSIHPHLTRLFLSEQSHHQLRCDCLAARVITTRLSLTRAVASSRTISICCLTPSAMSYSRFKQNFNEPQGHSNAFSSVYSRGADEHEVTKPGKLHLLRRCVPITNGNSELACALRQQATKRDDTRKQCQGRRWA